MDEKQLQFLYSEYAKNKGFKDYSEFKGLMSSEESRKLFFDDANKELGFKDYNEFNDLLGLKKKGQEVLPSVSSPSKSQLVLPDFEKGRAFAEKGFLMQGEGTKAPKPEKRISFEPSFNIGAPFQVKVLEEGEEPSFASDLMTAGARGQIQGKVANLLPAGKVPTNEELGEIAQLQSDAKLLPQSKAEKAYQEKGLKGLFSESPLLGAQFVGETMLSSLSSLVEASTRTAPTAIAAGAGAGAAFGGIGALPGAAMGLLAGQSAAGYNLSTSQDILNSLSENGVDISDKDSLIKAFSDEKKMAKIRNTAAKYGIPILIFDAATAGLAGKLATGAIGKSLSKKILAGLGEAGIQMTGGAGGELAGQIASGKKVNWDDVAVEAIAEVPGGAVEVATGIALERSKTSSNNNTLATQIAIQGPEDGVKDAVLNLNRDLANNVITPEQHQEGMNFVEKAVQVSSKIPETVTGESKAKSIELLVERNNIKENNQILEQQKQSSDEAYHAGINEEIKANEEKIKKIDSEVYNIAKNPIPVKEKKFKTIPVIDERGELEFPYNVPVSDERTFITRKDYEAEVNQPSKPAEIPVVEPTEEVTVTEEVKPTELEVKEAIEPIRQLGTGANVYFENNKYRVNDNSKGKVLLNIEGKEDGGMSIANIEFDSAKEAVEVAKELSKIYPNGVPDAVLINKVVDDIKNKIKVKPTEVKEKTENFPRFTSYNDAQEWIKSKSKEYKSKNEFLTSQEYKNALPDINALYEIEKSDYSKKAKQAMGESGVKIGDRVIYDHVTPIGVEAYSGEIVDRQGIPFVKFDEGQKTLSGKQSVRWHKGFVKEVKPTEVKEEPLKENEYYHATDATEILAPSDKGYKKREGANVVGEGIYFGKDKEHLTDRYGKNAIKAELDIKNPLISNNKYIVVDGREIDVQSLSKEDINFLKQKGYDAIKYEAADRAYSNFDETIVFDKNQIKIKEKVKPTEVKVSEEVNPTEVEETANALKSFDKIIKGNKTAGTEVYRKAVDLINEKKTHEFTGKGWEDVAEAYHKALKNGKNPELVELIDKTLVKENAKVEKPTEVKTKEEQQAVTKEEETNKQLAETELLLSGEAEKRRKEGKFIKDGIEYNRNEKQKGEVGNNGEVRFTNDVSLPFKYKLVEAETIQPSHENGIRNPLHFVPEAQPKNRNDIGSLQAEESFANNPRFDELGENTNAYSGSPVVNERGEVIQGNNRSAGLRKGYKRGNIKYKTDLANNAEKFGFTKEQVEGMNNPVLVREIAVSDAGAIELGNYDVKDLETGGKRRLDPVSITRRMPFELKGRISEVLFKGDDTLNKSLRDNSKKILELISPYLNQSQRNTLFKDGTLTESGAKDLEAVVQHFLFDGGDVALPDLFESLSHTQKEGLRKSLPSIFSTSSEKSITPQIQEAIIAINSFNESGINSFDNWLTQTDMFNEGKTPNDTFSPTAIAIAKVLNIGSQKEIVAEFAKYADAVKDKPATMFEGATEGVSKKDAIKQIFKTEYDETAEQQKAIGSRSSKEAVGEQEATEEPKPKSKSKSKPKPTESQAVKDYKEAVKKAGKKARENAKNEFVDRNFDKIIEKLKIEIKCPT